MAKRKNDLNYELGYEPDTRAVPFKSSLGSIFSPTWRFWNFLRQTFYWPNKVRSMARSDARSGLPPSDAKELGNSERLLLNYRNSTIATIGGSVAKSLKWARDWLLKFMPQPFLTEKYQAELSAYLNDKITAVQGKLAATAERYEETRARLERFRKDRKIDRDPTVNVYLIDSLGPLMLFAVVEIIANASLLGSVSQQGFIGGAVYAVTFSVINVLWALLVGMIGWRYALYGNGAQRFWAIAFTIFGVSLTVFMNLFIAQYRQLAEETLRAFRANPDEFGVLEAVPFSDVLVRVFTAPALDSREAILLLILGLGIAIFATYEGMWKLVDRVPDYGAVWKDFKKARRERDKVITKMTKVLGQDLDDFTAEIVQVEIVHDFYQKEIRKAKILIQQFYQEAQEHAGMADAWAIQWIRVYRSINANERAKLSRKSRAAGSRGDDSVPDPGPAPEYFSRSFRFEVGLPSVNDAIDEADAGLRVIGENISKLAMMRTWIADRKQRLRQDVVKISADALISATAEEKIIIEMQSRLRDVPNEEFFEFADRRIA